MVIKSVHVRICGIAIDDIPYEWYHELIANVVVVFNFRQFSEAARSYSTHDHEYTLGLITCTSWARSRACPGIDRARLG